MFKKITHVLFILPENVLEYSDQDCLKQFFLPLNVLQFYGNFSNDQYLVKKR